MPDGYEVTPVSIEPATTAHCAALLRLVFPKARHLTTDYLEWEYAKNPAGEVVGFNAWSGPTLAAHYATVPLVARVKGEERRGLLSLNTATHPDHQGKKLFVTLAERTFAFAAEKGYSFVVGVANANSTPGFVKKLGFRLVAPLDAKLGVGWPTRRETNRPISFERVWDGHSLKWRTSNPSARYAIRQRNGTIGIESPTDKPGIRALLGLFDPSVFPAPNESSKIGLRPITLSLGLDPAVDWKREPFGAIPRALRPSPLNLIFKSLDGRGGDLSPTEVRFQAIDFDPY
jgi:GNAT superfamily N-acetyltransferase